MDDGKSTLIGRLLYESKLLFDDQLAALGARLAESSARRATTLDFALLVDGLAAEREQGITIDVAYRFFSTEQAQVHRRRHARATSSTRATWSPAPRPPMRRCCSIDARKGVLTQTRRHSYLAVAARHSPCRARDQQDGSRGLFGEALPRDRGAVPRLREADRPGRHHLHPGLRAEGRQRARAERYARRGIAVPPSWAGWRRSRSTRHGAASPFRLPVQWVNRPHLDFRGFAGTIASGTCKPGDRVRVLPSGRESRVARIVTADGDLAQAVAGQSITLTLADEIDVSRGDVISAAEAPAEVADQFEATVVWMSDEPMLRGRSYLLKIGTKTVTATIAPLKHQVDVDTLEHLAAEKLELNEIGVCELELDQPVAFDAYRRQPRHRRLHPDRPPDQPRPSAPGMLHFALRRAHNIHLQARRRRQGARVPR